MTVIRKYLSFAKLLFFFETHQGRLGDVKFTHSLIQLRIQGYIILITMDCIIFHGACDICFQKTKANDPLVLSGFLVSKVARNNAFCKTVI